MKPLDILGLMPGCSISEVKARWRELAPKYHPDHHPNDPVSLKKFLEIKDAYDAILKNPVVLEKPTRTEHFNVRVEVPVTIEDFYFYRTIFVKITRRVFCKKCRGTGSKRGIPATCPHCDGAGVIKVGYCRSWTEDRGVPCAKGPASARMTSARPVTVKSMK